MCFEEEVQSVMGGPFDITKISKSQTGMSMWDMLDRVCYNYSTENSWDGMVYLSDGKRLFENIKTPLLTTSYYNEIKPKIVKLQTKEENEGRYN